MGDIDDKCQLSLQLNAGEMKKCHPPMRSLIFRHSLTIISYTNPTPSSELRRHNQPKLPYESPTILCVFIVYLRL
jgi:hypothetical protein